MRKRLYDTGDFKIYYPDDNIPKEKESNFDPILFMALIRFIAIGIVICFAIFIIMFRILP